MRTQAHFDGFCQAFFSTPMTRSRITAPEVDVMMELTIPLPMLTPNVENNQPPTNAPTICVPDTKRNTG